MSDYKCTIHDFFAATPNKNGCKCTGLADGVKSNRLTEPVLHNQGNGGAGSKDKTIKKVVCLETLNHHRLTCATCGTNFVSPSPYAEFEGDVAGDYYPWGQYRSSTDDITGEAIRIPNGTNCAPCQYTYKIGGWKHIPDEDGSKMTLRLSLIHI